MGYFIPDCVSTIILIRHVESVKNIRNIHGGCGDALTPEGVGQILTICNRLVAFNYLCPISTIIYHSQNIQVRETAVKLNVKLRVGISESSLINPAHLGRLHSLSDHEAKNEYPVEYELMQKWRLREIDIASLKVVGIEDPCTYLGKGKTFISSLIKKNNIIICSTSAMIMLTHLLAGRSPVPGGGYKHIPINNGNMIFYQNIKRSIIINEQYTDKHLLEYIS